MSPSFLFYHRTRNTVNAGYFNKSLYYPVKIVHVEYPGDEYLEVKYKESSDSYKSDWTGLLTNFLDGELYCRIFRTWLDCFI